MRVISQNGTLDVPYENVAFTVDKSGEYVIHGHTAYEYKACLLAKYSTEEKALKAVEMLRKSYKNNKYYLSIISSAVRLKLTEKDDEKDLSEILEIAMESCIFQFPADEDLEE